MFGQLRPPWPAKQGKQTPWGRDPLVLFQCQPQREPAAFLFLWSRRVGLPPGPARATGYVCGRTLGHLSTPWTREPQGCLGKRCSQPSSTIFQMGKLRPSREEVSVVREPGLGRRSTVASLWPVTCQEPPPPIRASFPEGKLQIAKLHSQHPALVSRTPGVLLAKLTNGGLFPVCRQRSFSGERFHSLQSFSPELLCKPLAPAAAGLGGKWPLT